MTVNYTLVWAVLKRFGVRPSMLSVVRKCHDGVRVCVRVVDGLCSGWSSAEQGIDQGRILAPLLVKIFTATSNVALAIVCLDPDIEEDVLKI